MNKILIYGSQYEHINRGLLDYLQNTYNLKNLQIILVVCNNSMRSCYINHRISNIEYKDAIAKNGPAPGIIPKIIPAPIPKRHHNKENIVEFYLYVLFRKKTCSVRSFSLPFLRYSCQSDVESL